jgi:hypothetical protein
MNDRGTHPLRPTRPVRRLIRLAHLIAALGWIGVDVVFGVLAVTGFTSEDLGTVAACYRALDIFVVPLLLLFGLTTLGTGLVLSISSGWGVIRYWWVAAKLLINVILSGLVFLLLAPRLASAGVEATRIDFSLRDRLQGIPVDLLFPPFVSGAALLAASLLGTVKPWGRTPYGRRRLASARRSTTSRT